MKISQPTDFEWEIFEILEKSLLGCFVLIEKWVGWQPFLYRFCFVELYFDILSSWVSQHSITSLNQIKDEKTFFKSVCILFLWLIEDWFQVKLSITFYWCILPHLRVNLISITFHRTEAGEPKLMKHTFVKNWFCFLWNQGGGRDELQAFFGNANITVITSAWPFKI